MVRYDHHEYSTVSVDEIEWIMFHGGLADQCLNAGKAQFTLCKIICWQLLSLPTVLLIPLDRRIYEILSMRTYVSPLQYWVVHGLSQEHAICHELENRRLSRHVFKPNEVAHLNATPQQATPHEQSR